MIRDRSKLTYLMRLDLQNVRHRTVVAHDQIFSNILIFESSIEPRGIAAGKNITRFADFSSSLAFVQRREEDSRHNFISLLSLNFPLTFTAALTLPARPATNEVSNGMMSCYVGFPG